MARKMMAFELDSTENIKLINQKLSKGWAVIKIHKLSKDEDPNNVFIAILEKRKK